MLARGRASQFPGAAETKHHRPVAGSSSDSARGQALRSGPLGRLLPEAPGEHLTPSTSGGGGIPWLLAAALRLIPTSCHLRCWPVSLCPLLQACSWLHLGCTRVSQALFHCRVHRMPQVAFTSQRAEEWEKHSHMTLGDLGAGAEGDHLPVASGRSCIYPSDIHPWGQSLWWGHQEGPGSR